MDNEKILLNPTDVICGRHGEVFKARWPLGYPIFSIMALERVLAQPDFGSAVTRLMEDPDVPDVTTLAAAVRYQLASIPLCCRLPKAELLDLYNEINTKEHIWPHRHCDLCKRQRPGGPYRRMPGKNVSAYKNFKHVCLRCVCLGQDGR